MTTKIMHILGLTCGLAAFQWSNGFAQSDECAVHFSQGVINTLSVNFQARRGDISIHTMCEDLRRAKTENKTSDAEASYKFIAAKYGVSKSFTEEFERQYCENDQKKSVSEKLLDIVTNQIDPAVGEAYNRCKALTSAGLVHSVTYRNDNAELELQLWKRTVKDGQKPILLEKLETSPPDSACSGTLVDLMGGGKSVPLEGVPAVACKRVVDVVEQPEGRTRIKRSLVVRIYTSVGLVSTELLRVAEVIEPAINPIKDHLVPKGAVLAFNRETCPEPWKPYKPAEGRLIVGVDGGAFKLGKAGGDWKKTIKVEHLPAIVSTYSTGTLQSKTGGDLAHYQGEVHLINRTNGDHKQLQNYTLTVQSKKGEKNDQFDIAPPWHALIFCEKKE